VACERVKPTYITDFTRVCVTEPHYSWSNPNILFLLIKFHLKWRYTRESLQPTVIKSKQTSYSKEFRRHLIKACRCRSIVRRTNTNFVEKTWTILWYLQTRISKGAIRKNVAGMKWSIRFQLFFYGVGKFVRVYLLSETHPSHNGDSSPL